MSRDSRPLQGEVGRPPPKFGRYNSFGPQSDIVVPNIANVMAIKCDREYDQWFFIKIVAVYFIIEINRQPLTYFHKPIRSFGLPDE